MCGREVKKTHRRQSGGFLCFPQRGRVGVALFATSALTCPDSSLLSQWFTRGAQNNAQLFIGCGFKCRCRATLSEIQTDLQPPNRSTEGREWVSLVKYDESLSKSARRKAATIRRQILFGHEIVDFVIDEQIKQNYKIKYVICEFSPTSGYLKPIQRWFKVFIEIIVLGKWPAGRLFHNNAHFSSPSHYFLYIAECIRIYPITHPTYTQLRNNIFGPLKVY